MSKPHTIQEINEWVDAYKKGRSLNEIAEEAGLTKPNIRCILHRNGIFLRPLRQLIRSQQPIVLSKQQIDFETKILCETIDDKRKIKDVIKDYGISRTKYYQIKNRWIINPEQKSRNDLIFKEYQEGIPPSVIARKYFLNTSYVIQIIHTQRFHLNGATEHDEREILFTD